MTTTTTTMLLALAILCAAVATVAAVRMAIELEKRGVRTRFLFLGVLTLRNLRLYSRLTREETGRVGPLFWAYVVPINAALIIVVALLAARGTR